jgi:hypothetical protein
MYEHHNQRLGALPELTFGGFGSLYSSLSDQNDQMDCRRHSRSLSASIYDRQVRSLTGQRARPQFASAPPVPRVDLLSVPANSKGGLPVAATM